MPDRATLALCLVCVLAAAAGCSALTDGSGPQPSADPANGTYERPIDPPESANESAYPATVSLYDGDQRVATVLAETATNGAERFTGLSEHDSLEPWQGMLFVYGQEEDLTYVMRDMSFGIDIVYVTSAGCVDSAHAAPQPAAGESGEEDHHRYSGHGQYVVEVPIGVATNASVDAGDPVVIEYDGTTIDGRGSCGASQT